LAARPRGGGSCAAKPHSCVAATGALLKGSLPTTSNTASALKTHLTALGLSPECIDPPPLWSLQCHLSSLSLRTSDCHSYDPHRRTHRRLWGLSSGHQSGGRRASCHLPA